MYWKPPGSQVSTYGNPKMFSILFSQQLSEVVRLDEKVWMAHGVSSPLSFQGKLRILTWVFQSLDSYYYPMPASIINLLHGCFALTFFFLYCTYCFWSNIKKPLKFTGRRKATNLAFFTFFPPRMLRATVSIFPLVAKGDENIISEKIELYH